MIAVRCACGGQLKVAESDRGKTLKCPRCGQMVLVPSAPAETLGVEEARTDLNYPIARSTAAGNAPAIMPLRLAHYDILGRLGAGGMGEVYLGRDSLLERDVAIKVLLRELAADQKLRDRFVREAKAAARLNHAHVVTVYQVGIENDIPFLAMELMPGGSLADAVEKAGRLKWRYATGAIRDAATGLAAAHAVGLIHRDIKPANLLRDSNRVVKLADFGLARLQSQATQLTRTGHVVGTPTYMAPEQFRGVEPDPRSDLYSLACTYYALVAGRPPFLGPTIPALIHQHLTQAPPDPRQFAKRLPDGVCQILARGLQKDPAARYQSAEEFLVDLDALLAIPQEALTYNSPRSGVAAIQHWLTQPPKWLQSANSLPTPLRSRGVLLGLGFAAALLLFVGLIVGLGGDEAPPGVTPVRSPASSSTVGAAPRGSPENANGADADAGVSPEGVPPGVVESGTSGGGTSGGGTSGGGIGGGAGGGAGGGGMGGSGIGGGAAGGAAGDEEALAAFPAVNAIGGPDEAVWQPAVNGALGAASKEWLLVEFPRAVRPKTIRVHQVRATGALFKIEGQRPDGREEQIFFGNDPGERGQENVVSEFAVKADWAMRRVRLHFDISDTFGQNAIDAVQLIEEDGTEHWAVAGAASSSLAPGRGYMRSMAGAGGVLDDRDPRIADGLNIAGLVERVTDVGVKLGELAEVLPDSAPAGGERPEDVDPAVAAWLRATVEGKYCMLLQKIDRPDDFAERGEFLDLQRQETAPFAGEDLPENAHWVYVAPYWYAWRDGPNSPDAPPTRFGPEQAVGPANTPRQNYDEKAWATQTEDEKDEWLLLEFAQPVAPKSLQVYESYNPGALLKVVAYQLGDKLDDKEVTAWSRRRPLPPRVKPGILAPGGGAPPVPGMGALMGGDEPTAVVDITLKGIKVRITRLKLFLMSDRVAGFNQIDAVELIDQDGVSHWPVAAAASSSLADALPEEERVLRNAEPMGMAGEGAGRTVPEKDLSTSPLLDADLSRLEIQLADLVARLPADALDDDAPTLPNLHELRLLRLESAIEQLGQLVAPQ